VKAFLLAGGRGERLRPLTLSTPKCLVPINGTPLLAIWLDLCAREGITDVMLNVSHHVGQIDGFLVRHSGSPRVKVVVEDAPRGTARTVLDHRDFVADAESFWILYADNLTDARLGALLETHRRHDDVLTMGLFHAPVPRAAGIVDLDGEGRIVGFEEKPPSPRGDLANAGIYLARQSLFSEMPPTEGLLDFGHDVLPRLVGRMHGHVMHGFLMDVGTPTALAAASAAWEALAVRGLA
jgi:mannose-1-phosphate guanylyltransferase